MVHSSEQQTRMLSAAEFDTLCVQETAIIDHCGATETVNLNEKSSLLGMPHPLPLLSTMHTCYPLFNACIDLGTHVGLHSSGAEAYSSEQKIASSPGLQTVQNCEVIINIRIKYLCMSLLFLFSFSR